LKTYNLVDFNDDQDFLEKFAQKSGKLLRGGEPDLQTVAKMVLNDFQRGRLPHYMMPPGYVEDEQQEKTGNKIQAEQQDFTELEQTITDDSEMTTTATTTTTTNAGPPPSTKTITGGGRGHLKKGHKKKKI